MTTQDPEPTPAAPVFQLPKSGLTLSGTRLVRRGETGGEVAEFELQQKQRKSAGY